MEIKSVTAVYFSPTGGVRCVASDIAAGIGGGEARQLDVTVSPVTVDFTPEDVVVLGVPVFGGRVPSTAAQRLESLNGNGAPAVILAVYGNRAYEDALLELKLLAQARGFRVTAAGAFIARHSIMPEFGAGRPDGRDRAAQAKFAAAVRARLEHVRSAAELPSVIVPGNRDYRQYGGVPLKPAANKIKCGKCGKCASNCPVGAISGSDPTKTDDKKCISCMRCISVCPHYARSVNPAVLLVSRQKLKKVCSERKEPETFM